MSLCIDMANYTAIPTAAQVECCINQGVKKAIIGTSFGDRWQGQIAAFERGGITCEEYQFVLRMRPSTRRVWLDAELNETVDTIRSAVTQNHPYGIYTRRGWWVDSTANWNILREFPWLKLWDANYGPLPRRFIPYGGWTEPEIVQWHDTTTLCGLNVDLNEFAEEEDDMPVQLVWCPDRGQLFEVGSGEPKPVLYPKDADELRAIYGPEKVAMSYSALIALGAS